MTVADDGGSSGRLRQQLGIVPPGDIRNCIAALADAEPLMTQLMQYRFPPGSGLDDHAFGNLFIAAMTAVTGDFEEAVRESNRVLAVRGQVLPATSVPLNLAAILQSGRRLAGPGRDQPADEPIASVSIEPRRRARQSARRSSGSSRRTWWWSGPGSLFSSVLPNLLISDIRDAVAGGNGVRVYVCNVATQPGETGFYSAAQHLEALIDHVGDGLFDYVLLNDNHDARRPEGWLGQPVQVDVRRLEELRGDDRSRRTSSTSANAHRHDPAKLAAALMRIQQQDRAERPRQRRTVSQPTASAG